MDKIMPKIMDAFEKVNCKQAERTDELAVKMETVLNRVENIRNADNLRTMIEIDRIHQVQKDKTLRIIGLPEDRDVADFVSNIAKKTNTELDPRDIECHRVGKPKQSIPGADRPNPRPAFVTFRSGHKKSEFLRNKLKAREDLKRDRIMIFEDLTKARRTLLAIVKEKHRNAHTRNGVICFFNNNELVRINKPDDLFTHGFIEHDVRKYETALMNTV